MKILGAIYVISNYKIFIVLEILYNDCVCHVFMIMCIIMIYSQDDQTPLYSAIEGGHLYIIELLLSRGADVNERDKVRIPYRLTQEKCRVNTDPFLHRIYTIGLYMV